MEKMRHSSMLEQRRERREEREETSVGMKERMDNGCGDDVWREGGRLPLRAAGGTACVPAGPSWRKKRVKFLPAGRFLRK